MTRFLHTMVRITDPVKSRAFYEALGFTFARDLDIVRDGELEATNYFFSLGDQDSVLELTYNHDGRTYDLGSATATSRSASTISTGRWSGWRSRESSRSGRRTRCAKAARGSASSAIRMVSFEH
jgi:catechol 2,3-dioxygenase-like lactoylglutathione lyase family enzyme